MLNKPGVVSEKIRLLRKRLFERNHTWHTCSESGAHGRQHRHVLASAMVAAAGHCLAHGGFNSGMDHFGTLCRSQKGPTSENEEHHGSYKAANAFHHEPI
jgi:hypothetical protein